MNNQTLIRLDSWLVRWLFMGDDVDVMRAAWGVGGLVGVGGVGIGTV